MRASVWVLLYGCSTAAPPPSNTAPATGDTPSAVDPEKPADFVALTRPSTTVCELWGPVGDTGLDLGISTGIEPYANVVSGEAILSFGDDGSAFAQVRLPASNVLLRGFASVRRLSVGKPSKALALVYARHWLAFGGVYYQSAALPLRVLGVRGDKLVVTFGIENHPSFTLDDSALTTEVSCGGVSLTQKPGGVLFKMVPPAFQASDKEQFMWLTGTEPVAVSAVAGGPSRGRFAVTPDDPLQVVVLERRGPHARIRSQHVAGWIDAARLSLTRAKPQSDIDPNTIGAGPTPLPLDLRATFKDPRTSNGRLVACDTDVPLVVTQVSSRFVVGSVPKGQVLPIYATDEELAYLLLLKSTITVDESAKFAVPVRDVTRCAQPAEVLPFPFGLWEDALRAKPPLNERILLDAISALPAEPTPKKALNLQFGNIIATGRLPPETVSRIVHQNVGRFRFCYEQGLAKNAALDGSVAARFVIQYDGSIASVANAGSIIPDASVVRCVLNSFYSLSFPPSDDGSGAAVVVPIHFSRQ
jgi:hypothetical protein